MIGTADGMKEWAETRGTDLTAFSDDQLEAALETATDILNNMCNRQLLADETNSEKTFTGNNRVIIPINECASIDTVTLNGVELVRMTDYAERSLSNPPFWGLVRLPEGAIWYSTDVVVVSAKWGAFEIAPPTIVEAVYRTAEANTALAGSDNVRSVTIQGVSVSLGDSDAERLSFETLLRGYIRSV